MAVVFIDESGSASQSDYEQLHRETVRHCRRIIGLPGSRAAGRATATAFELIEVAPAPVARAQPRRTATVITSGGKRSSTKIEAHDEANDASAQTASPCPPPLQQCPRHPQLGQQRRETTTHRTVAKNGSVTNRKPRATPLVSTEGAVSTVTQSHCGRLSRSVSKGTVFGTRPWHVVVRTIGTTR